MISFIEGRHRTDDGAEIVYRHRPGRSPWVLLHGLGCDGSMWDEVIAAFPEVVGFLAPDLRGHGRSTLGWRLPSVDLWAEDVLQIVDALQMDRPAFAGLSMGGYTLLGLAARRPDRARAYAFISTQAAPDDETALARRATGLAALRTGGWRLVAAGLMPLLLDDAGPRYVPLRERLMGMFEEAGNIGLAAALFALANRPDRLGVLRTVRSPSVVIWGDADRLIPRARAEEMAAELKESRLVILPGASHMSAMEVPAAVAAELMRL